MAKLPSLPLPPLPIPRPEPGERASMAAYRIAHRLPLIGDAVFSRVMRFAAPYFLTIPATVESAEPGRATARMADRPWVHNHLGTVHAIALCNLAELTMGVVAEATVPTTHRWIPKGMSVAYKSKARGTMHAVATLELPAALAPEGTELSAKISVTDRVDIEVFTADIELWVTPA